MKTPKHSKKPAQQLVKLRAENKKLRSRLAKAERTLQANRLGNETRGRLVGETVSLEDKAERQEYERKILTVQRDLEKSRDTYADLFDFAPVGYIIHNGVGIIKNINATASDMLGMERPALLGNSILSFVAKDEKRLAVGHLRRCRTGEPVVATVLTLVRRNQPDVIVEWRTVLYQDLKGHRQWRSALMDITARKAAEEAMHVSEEDYRRIVETANEGVMTADSSGTITFANTKMADMLGYAVNELIGKPGISFVFPEDCESSLARIGMRKAGTPELYDIRFIRKNGDIAWMRVSGTPVQDSEGRHIGNLGMYTDITERKQAEDALSVIQAQLSFALRASHAGVWNWNILTGATTWSPEYYQVYGIDPSVPPSYEDWMASILPEDREPIDTLLRASLVEHREDIDLEFRVWHPEKGLRWLSVIGRVSYENRRPVVMAGITLDITDRKQATEALRQSEEKYRNLVKYAPAAIYEMDLEGAKFFSVNKVMCEILGYSREELLALRPADLLDPESRSSFRERMKRKLAGEKIYETVEYRARRKDGKWIDTAVNVGAFSYTHETPTRVVVIGYDITERKRIQEALRESEERYRLLVRHAPAGIYEIDFTTGRFTEVNDAMCLMSGYTRDEFLAMNAFDLLDDEGKDRFTSRIRLGQSGERPEDAAEYRVRAKDGHIIWALVNSTFHWRDGKIVGATVIAHDITERKRMEEALNEASRKAEHDRLILESIFHQMPAGIIIADPSGTVARNNEAMDKIWKREMLPTENIDDHGYVAYHQDGREYEPEEWPLTRALRNGEEIVGEEMSILRGDGTKGTVLASSAAIRDITGQIIAGVVIDVDMSERKQMETALLESEARFRSVLDNSRDVIYRLNVQTGRYEYISPSAEKVMGVSADELMAQDVKKALSMIHPDDLPAVLAAHARLKETGEGNVEYRQMTKGGDYRWLSNHLSLTRDSAGRPLYRSGNLSDITERKRAEETLRRSEALLLQTGMMAKVGGWELDVQSMTLSWSLETYRIHEVEPSLHPDVEKAIDFYAPEARPVLTEAIQRAIEDGLSFDLELPLITATGKHLWVRAMGQSESCDGKCVRLVGTFQDITERRKKEDELQRVNRTLIAHSESSKALIRSVDETEYLNQVCRIVVKDCGHAMVWIGLAENDEDKSIRPVAHAGFEKGYLETLKLTWADTERGRGPTGTAIRTGKVAVCRNMLSDPLFAPWRAEAIKRGYASSIVFPLIADALTFGAMTIYSREPDPFSGHEERLLTGLANDLALGIHTIRLRKAHARTEEALQESDRRFRLALRNAPVSVAAQDRNLRFIWAYNQRSVNPADVIGKTDTDLFAPEDSDRLISLKREVLETGNEKTDSFWITSNGTRMFLDIFVEPVRNEKGEVSGIGVATVDLTGSKLAEQAIARARKEWERTFDAVPDLIAVMDKNHHIVRANRAMAQKLHLTPGQCVGRLCYSSVHGTNAPPAFCPHVLTMSDGGEHVVEIHEEGLGGDFIVSTTPMHDEDGNLVGSVHVARDITERKSAEDTIRNQYALLKSIVESPGSPVFSVDNEFRYTCFNKSHSEVMKALYGAEIEVGKSMLDYHSVDQDRSAAKSSIDRVLQGETFTVNSWVGADETSKRYFEITHNPVKDREGCIVGAAVFANDVTERKRSQRQIEHLASFPRLNPNAILEMDKEGTIIYFNDAALKTAQELGAGMNVRILLPQNIDEILSSAKKAEESKAFFRDLTVGGRTFTETIHSSKELGVIRIYCTEITRRKQMEHTLRRSAEEYRLLMEEASDAILMTDEKGNIVAVNARLCEMLDRDKNEFLALTMQELMPGEDSAAFHFSREDGTAHEPRVLDHRMKRKDGTLIHVQTSMKKLASGRIQSIVRDVTRQKEKEQKLMQVMQEEVFEKLFLKLRAFKHGQSGAMNLNRLALFADNFSAISRILTSDPPDRNRDLLDRFGIAAEEFNTLVAPELEHIASLMVIAEVDTTLTVSADIRSTADKLLMSVEHLKGRIHHVMSLTKENRADVFAQTYPSIQEDILGTINKIRYALSDVSAFIETNFTCQVSAVARATIQKFEASASTLSVYFDDETPGSKAIVNPSELGAILSILMENSVEALGRSAGTEPQKENHVHLRTESVGHMIRIIVEDNGPGVPDDIREHLFETGVSGGKSPDRGFGLGYARRCITRYGGRISHDASVKQGARFVIEIPKA